jgi:hypothetical protein
MSESKLKEAARAAALQSPKGMTRGFDSPQIQAYVKVSADGKTSGVDINLMLTDLIACCKVAGVKEYDFITWIKKAWPQIEVHKNPTQ